MNKSELVASIASKADMTKADAQKALEAMIDSVTAALQNDDKVSLVGFGTWSVATRAATTGRNPRTGEEIKIPQSKQAKFKAGKELKEAVNN